MPEVGVVEGLFVCPRHPRFSFDRTGGLPNMDPRSPLRERMTMTCPVCHLALQPMVREGIEIDYCPSCRGVWLDRGELDKIIEREAHLVQGRRGEEPRGYREERRPDRDDDDRYHGGGKRRKRGGLLGELLDFD
jgi:Zn-finger nucleic acid-binding protein